MIRQKILIDQVLFKGSIEEFEATARDCAVKIHGKLLESDIFAIPPVGYEEPPYRGVAKVSLENPDGPEDIVGIVIASPEPGKIARLDVYRYEGTTGCEKAWGLLKAELVQRGWIDVQPAASAVHKGGQAEPSAAKGALVNKPNSQRPLRVFLCHASNDKPAVRALYQRLCAEGINAWLDEEKLLPGQDWQREIPKAVRDSDVVIVCLSRGSINKAGYVQKEIQFALDVADEQPEGAIFLIPAKLEECEVPDRLRRWQWVNYYEEAGWERLMRALAARSNAPGIAQTLIPSKSPRGPGHEVKLEKTESGQPEPEHEERGVVQEAAQHESERQPTQAERPSGTGGDARMIAEMGYKLDEREVPLAQMSMAKFTGLLASLDNLECRHSGSDGELEQWHVKHLTGKQWYITALPIGNVLQVKIYCMPWDVPRKRTVSKDASGAEWESAEDQPAFGEMRLVPGCDDEWESERALASGNTQVVEILDAALFKLQPPSAALDNGQGKEKSADGVLTVKYRTKLRQNLVEHFNKEELRTLCVDLDIKYENFPEALDGMAREIVAYCARTGRIHELVAKCCELRPNVSWSEA